MVRQTRYTAEDLAMLSPRKEGRFELVRGELVEMPSTGYRHGRVAARVGRLLGNYVEEHRLGDLLVAGTGFLLSRNPDTVRTPDIAFVQKARVPRTVPEGYAEFAPDLVAEVISPNETSVAVHDRVGDWLRAGVRQVWLVYPQMQQVVVYDSAGGYRILGRDGALDGGNVLPGFSCPVKDIFKSLDLEE